jgi:MFS family permease
MMAVGMFAASLAASIPALAAARLLTGLGIGGMLASTSAIVAEVSNSRRRSLNLSLNIAGYPAGAILGGSVASLLLRHDGNWRSVFQLGCIATVMALPLAWVLVQESIEFLLTRQPRRALERLNRILTSFSRPTLDELPLRRVHAVAAPLRELFSRAYAAATILLTATYFAQIMVFYFIQKWIPKIVVDLGHTAAEAGVVLVSANIGCLLGAVAIGVASQRVRVNTLIVGAMAVAFCCVAAVGATAWSLSEMAGVCFVAGFFVNAGVVGLYPVMAQSFPAEVRASGIGFAIGVGRGGAALGPMAAGALFSAGYSLALVSAVMGSGALAAAIFLLWLARLQTSGPP